VDDVPDDVPDDAAGDVLDDVAVDAPDPPEGLDVLDESDEDADAAVSFFAPPSDGPEPFAPEPAPPFADARESVL
jgi:hypothetical protein